MRLPSGQTLPHILAHHLQTSPERIAVVLVTRSGEEHPTVRKLLARAQDYGEIYRRSGVPAGDVVVDLRPPGADLLSAFLGDLAGGGPVHPALPNGKARPDSLSREPERSHAGHPPGRIDRRTGAGRRVEGCPAP